MEFHDDFLIDYWIPHDIFHVQLKIIPRCIDSLACVTPMAWMSNATINKKQCCMVTKLEINTHLTFESDLNHCIL
jgi:hypothetical protein